MRMAESKWVGAVQRWIIGGLICWGLMGLLNAVDRSSENSFAATEGVQTTRDDKGVWFITGPEDATCFNVMEAMGYAVATDRLWQSELYRRQARGRLAEIFGTSQLETDIYIRTTGYSDQEIEDGFAALDAECQSLVNGYVAGFNRRIAEVNADPTLLPFEFKALGLSAVEEWNHKDVLCWLAILQRNFDPEAQDTFQIDNMKLLAALSAAYPQTFMGMFNDLRWKNDPKALTYIPASQAVAAEGQAAEKALEKEIAAPDVPNAGGAAKNIVAALERVEGNLEAVNAKVKMGSYAWTVSGTKTESGKPIIYSGPQMGFPVPSIVLEGSIRAGGLNVSGMSVPGIPAIIIGRTPHHAWSMQVANAHTVDFYIENPADVTLNRTEVIKVAGADDVQLPVYRSSHGPVINPMPYDPGNVTATNPAIAWKYSHWGYEFKAIEGFRKLARATSMDEFGEGIELMAVSQHFCYADVDGNIAYWMSGRDPVRADGEWRLPQGLLGPALEWDAATLIQRTTDRNTTQGYYSGWNNKSRPGYENAYNSAAKYFGPFNRAHVIDDYLSTRNNLTYDEVNNLALNIATTDSWEGGGNPWKFVRSDFIAALGATPTQAQQDAVDLLEAWDGHFVDGGPSEWVAGKNRADAWKLMDAWIREVMRLTFADELEPLSEYKELDILFNVLLHGLAGQSSGVINTYDWFQNLSDSTAPQSANEIIVAALDNALTSLGIRPWGTDARGSITYRHAMAGTVWTTPYSNRSTYAHCVQFASWGPDRIKSMFPLGSSGTILMDEGGSPVFDANFFTMTPIYDAFAPRDFPLFSPTPAVRPDIRVNNSDGPVTVTPNDSASITISIDPGGQIDDMADWWLAVHTPFAPPLDWYTYVYPTGWTPGIHLCAQAGLFSLTPFEVLNTALPQGDYTFYFAIDEPHDGAAGPWWALDSVELSVQ